MAVIAFSISLIFFILFVALTIFERNGRFLWYCKIKDGGDRIAFSIIKKFSFHKLNTKEYFSVANIKEYTITRCATFIAMVANRIEKKAHEVTRKMSRNSNTNIQETKSNFLKEISNYKEGLDTDKIKRETSLTFDPESKESS